MKKKEQNQPRVKPLGREEAKAIRGALSQNAVGYATAEGPVLKKKASLDPGWSLTS